MYWVYITSQSKLSCGSPCDVRGLHDHCLSEVERIDIRCKVMYTVQVISDGSRDENLRTMCSHG